MGLYAKVIGNSGLYNLGTKMVRFNDFFPKLGPLKEWYKERELPKTSHERFRDWYKKSAKKSVAGSMNQKEGKHLIGFVKR